MVLRILHKLGFHVLGCLLLLIYFPFGVPECSFSRARGGGGRGKTKKKHEQMQDELQVSSVGPLGRPPNGLTLKVAVMVNEGEKKTKRNVKGLSASENYYCVHEVPSCRVVWWCGWISDANLVPRDNFDFFL